MSLLRDIIRLQTQKKFKSTLYFLPKSLFRKGLSTSNDNRKFKALKTKQAKIQCDDGYPVHLKGGIMDKILYHITVGGCIIGLAQSFWLFYRLAQK